MQFLKKQTTKDRYGNETTYEFENQVKPLDQTEIMKMMMEQGVPQMPQGIPQMPMQQQAPQAHPGGPKGTDTVPAWLTPGEFVMNAKAVDKFGPQIEAMNNEGREEQGMQVPEMDGNEGAQYHAEGGKIDSYRPLALATEAMMDTDKVSSDDDYTGHVPFAVQAAKALGLFDSYKAKDESKGGEVNSVYEPSQGEISRARSALNSAKNATEKANINAALYDGQFKNAVEPEVTDESLGYTEDDLSFMIGQGTATEDDATLFRERGLVNGNETPEGAYGVPKMLNRVPQGQSGLNNLSTMGEDHLGPVPTVPAQAKVPTIGSSIANFFQPAVENFKSDTSAIVDGIKYNPDNSVVDGSGVTPYINSEDPFGSYRPDPKTPEEAAAAIKEAEDAYLNKQISLEGLEKVRADVEGDMAVKLYNDKDDLAEEFITINEEIARAKAAGLPTDDLESQLAQLEVDKVKGVEAVAINKNLQEQIKQDPKAYEDMGGLTKEDSDALIKAGTEIKDNTVPQGPPKPNVIPEESTWYDKVFESLKEAGGKLLSGDRLAEATLMYLGSRAMGYGHAGSLGFVSKQYLGGIQADQASIRAAKADKSKRALDMQDFSDKENIKANLDMQKAAIANGQVKIDRTKKITIAKDGKQRDVYETVDGAGNKGYVTLNGIPVDTYGYELEARNIKGTKEWNSRVETTASAYAGVYKELQERVGSYKDSDGNVTYATGITPKVAARETARWAAENDVPQEKIGSLVESAYTDAINHSKASGTQAKDIRPYLNQLVIRHKAGANTTLFQAGTNEDGSIKYVDASKLAGVNKAISNKLKDKGLKTKVSDVANQYYTAIVPEWNKLGPEARKKWESRANEGENGFYVYIANRLGLDKRKVK